VPAVVDQKVSQRLLYNQNRRLICVSKERKKEKVDSKNKEMSKKKEERQR
jgi:hypothetical protein